MERNQKYKIVILILSVFIVIESATLVVLLLRRRQAIKKMPKAALPVKGRIAIVLDDWGYNLDTLYIVEQIKYPFTASVLPRLEYSKAVALELHKLGFQIILHLPMEPHEKVRLEKNTVMTSMKEREIINIIGQDLDNINFAVGVSNHMGSKATEDLRTMRIILNELRKRNLFFLDSFVSPKTVCSDLAEKLQIRFIKRDIFLDNKENPEYINGQINKLKRKAMMYGYAVGIGHDRKITLEVLKETMPELEKEGYKLVFLSQLVK